TVRRAQQEFLRAFCFIFLENQGDTSDLLGDIKEQPNDLSSWIGSTPASLFFRQQCRFNGKIAVLRRNFNNGGPLKIETAEIARLNCLHIARHKPLSHSVNYLALPFI